VTLLVTLVCLLPHPIGTAWAQEEESAAGGARAVATVEQVPQPEVAAGAWVLTDARSGEARYGLH
jgi:D-alanyl-D-alanine carboxypeptidase